MGKSSGKEYLVRATTEILVEVERTKAFEKEVRDAMKRNPRLDEEAAVVEVIAQNLNFSFPGEKRPRRERDMGIKFLEFFDLELDAEPNPEPKYAKSA